MTVTRADATRSFFIFVQDKNTSNVTRIAIPSDTQVGTVAVPAELMLTGRLSLSSKVYEALAAGAVINIDGNVTIANVNSPSLSLGTAVSVVMPSNPRDGQLIVIKDASGTASVNNITVYSLTGALIDGASTKSITTAWGSMVLYWSENQWYQLASGVGTSGGGGGGAPVSASYVVLHTDSALTNERVLTASGSNIVMVDHGANSTLTLDLTATGVTAGSYTNTNLTVDAFGRITSASNGSSSGWSNSNNIGVWIDGTGKMKTTGSISIDSLSRYAPVIGTDVFFFVSGSQNVGTGANRQVAVVGGDLVVSGGVSGSLTKLANGASYLVAGANVTITSQSNGQVLIAAPASSTSGSNQPWVDGNNKIKTSGSVSIDGSNHFATDYGTDIFLYVSGSQGLTASTNRHVSVFSGDVVFSGSTAGIYKNVFTLEQFGAVGDGTTDDSPAMMAALTASAGGGTILFGSNKTYLLTANAPYSIPASGSIVGWGENSVVKITKDNALFVPGGDHTTFLNFKILGTGAAFTSQIGIANQNLGAGAGTAFHYMRIDGVTFDTLGAAGVLTYQGSATPPYFNALVTNCRFSQCGRGLWYLNEYSTATGFSIDACGTGIECEGGNQVFAGGTITGCTIGFLIDGGGNDAHGVVSGVEINHNTTNIKVYLSETNGEKFVDCMIYSGDILLQNTHGVQFIACQIDVSNYYFDNAIGTVFEACTFPVSAGANTIHNNYNGNTSSTRWINCFDLNGNVPAFITQGQDGTNWTNLVNGSMVVSGTLLVSGGISGSLTTLANGASYLVAGSGVTIVSQSNGQVLISSTGGGTSGSNQPWVDGNSKIKTSGSVSIDGSNHFATDYGTDVFFFVSGSQNVAGGTNRHVAVVGGDLVVSGGISGSITRLANGTSYLVAGSNITIVSQSNGQVVVSATSGGSSGSNQPWVDGNNKIKTSGSVSIDSDNHFATDYGTDVFLFVSGSKGVATGANRHVAVFGGDLYVSGNLSASAGLSGSLQLIAPNLPYLIAGSNIAISTSSNGQVTIATSAAISGSVLPITFDIAAVAGYQWTDQQQFVTLGSFEFNPTGADSMAPAGSTSYTAFLESLIECSTATMTIQIRLYNVTSNAIVATSTSTVSNTAALTRVKTANLQTALSGGTNLYDLQLIVSSGVGQAMVKGSKLRVTWS